MRPTFPTYFPCTPEIHQVLLLFLTMLGKDKIFATVMLIPAYPTPNTSAAVCGSQGYEIVEIMMSLAHEKKKNTQ